MFTLLFIEMFEMISKRFQFHYRLALHSVHYIRLLTELLGAFFHLP